MLTLRQVFRNGDVHHKGERLVIHHTKFLTFDQVRCCSGLQWEGYIADFKLRCLTRLLGE